jgi:hypothetical protein
MVMAEAEDAEAASRPSANMDAIRLFMSVSPFRSVVSDYQPQRRQ